MLHLEFDPMQNSPNPYAFVFYAFRKGTEQLAAELKDC